MPSIDLGRITPIPKGTWVSSTTYERLDIVNNNGDSYIAKQDVPINTSITTENYWQLLAGIGDPTDVQVVNAVSNWLENHPEITTTVDFDITTKIYDSVSSMIEDISLANGNNVKTNGYYDKYDCGGAFYKISTTTDRACSIQLENGFYAVLLGNKHTSRQLGIRENDKAQNIINSYIADTNYIELTILDPIILKKPSSGSSTDNIELIKIRRDNFTLKFEDKGKFILETLNEDFYRMIAINSNNINIIDPILIGDADTISITTGEYGHGLYIRGESNNINIYNGNISKCFGDAVGISNHCKKISIHGTMYCSDCGRQGISVIGCDDLYIDTLVGKNILRTGPAAVIDFEPNDTESPIRAHINTVVAENCYRGVMLHGGSPKTVIVDNLFAKHQSKNYVNDFQVGGTAATAIDSKIEAVVNNIVVENAFTSVIQIALMNDNATVKCPNVLVNGMNKSGTNSSAECTVIFKSGAKNVDINIKVINDISPNPHLGVWSIANNATYENVHIITEDDCAQIVTDSLGFSNTLINSAIINKPSSNNNHYISSSVKTIERTAETNYVIEAPGDYLTIINLKGTPFVLHKFNLTDYTLINTDNIVTDSSTYWTIADTAKIVSFIFNNTLKTITVKKII